jgi:tRNA nucleotidyltransferase/poly(A) polymerase
MKYICYIIFGFAMSSVITTSAQDFDSLATSLPKMKIVFSKILSDTPEFSAYAVVRTLDAKGNMQLKMPMKIALTTERMRQEIDVMGMTNLPEKMREAMQQAHINEIVVITQTDARRVYLAFPGIQAYEQFPISDAVLDEMTRRASAINIQKKEYGQQMIRNHLCTQVSLMFTETNRPAEFAILKCATDLHNFPIRMEFLTPTSTTRFSFESVQIKKPDADLFEVPENYTAFTNSADIMRYAKEKLQSNLNNTSL